MITYNGKPVAQIAYRYPLSSVLDAPVFDQHAQYIYDVNNSKWVTKTVTDYYSTSYTKAEIQQACTPTKGVDLSAITKAKLFFCSEAKFPRYKLSDNIKRSLKVDTADYIVLPDDDFSVFTLSGVLVDMTTYYGYIPNSLLENIAQAKYTNRNTIEEVRNDIYTKLGHPRVIDTTGITFVKAGSIKEKLIDDFMAATAPKITTGMLDKYISSTFDPIDEESAKMINDMLYSEDDANVAMGLKLMTSFNYYANPFIFRALLNFRGTRGRSSSAYHHVGVEKMIDGINFFANCHPGMDFFTPLNGKVVNANVIPEEDMRVINILWKDACNRLMLNADSQYIAKVETQVFKGRLSHE